MAGTSSLPGLDELRTHFAELRSPRGLLRVLALPVLLFLLISWFFKLEDRTGDFWLLDGEVVFLTIGFLSLSLFFRQKQRYMARYGDRAYATAFKRFAAPGLAIIAAVIVRLRFIPGPMVPHLSWYPILPALGWLMLAVGLLLWLRGVLACRLDTLMLLHVYVPEGGPMVDQAIYEVLRHPIYAAAQRMAFGLALLNGSWFALTLALILALYFWGWITLVEEKDLDERFGHAYGSYRQRVPAFWPRWKDIGRYLSILLTGR